MNCGEIGGSRGWNSVLKRHEFRRWVVVRFLQSTLASSCVGSELVQVSHSLHKTYWQHLCFYMYVGVGVWVSVCVRVCVRACGCGCGCRCGCVHEYMCVCACFVTCIIYGLYLRSSCKFSSSVLHIIVCAAKCTKEIRMFVSVLFCLVPDWSHPGDRRGATCFHSAWDCETNTSFVPQPNAGPLGEI